MPATKTATQFHIPDTRLPFVNAEIAQLSFQGSPHLVSSIWGGSSSGRIFFWNPQTGSRHMRVLPNGVPGAYMLRTGPDGLLYLGGGDGTLLRFNGETDTFETLVPTGEMTGICWGGVVTEKYVYWNATRNGRSGGVGVYDRQNEKLAKVFDPLDSSEPNALYGHRACVAPDGKIIWGLNMPKAAIALIDPADLTNRNVNTDYLGDNAWVSPQFIDDKTLIVFSGKSHQKETAYIVDYPSFELIEIQETPHKHGTQHDPGFIIGDHMYRIDNAPCRLYRFHIPTRKWELHIDNFGKDTRTTLGIWTHENGKQDIVGVNMFGETFCHDIESNTTTSLDLEPIGELPAHALCAVPEKNLIAGAPFINQRFWTIDTKTNAGIDQGRAAPGTGQINQIAWDPITQRVFMTSYTSAAITAYDPTKPTNYGENPVEMAYANTHNQMRPLDFVHDGEHLWMASGTSYGTLGGAISRLNPATGEFKIFDALLPDQRPTHLAPDPANRRLYFSTSIGADCGSTPPTQTTGLLCTFDLDKLEITAQTTVDENMFTVRLYTVLPDGRALVGRREELVAWTPETNTFEAVGKVGDVALVVVGPNDTLVGVTDTSVGVFNPIDGQYVFEPRLETKGTPFFQIAGDNMYWAKGDKVTQMPLSAIGL